MPRKLTSVPPPPKADDAPEGAVALPRARKRVTKAVAPAAVPSVPRPAEAPRATPAAKASTPRSETRPHPTGVRAARAVVRPLTSIAPAASGGLAPLTTPSGARLHPVGALPPARIPPEALHPPRDPNILAWAAGISVAVHLVVLTIHFAPPDLKRLF
ncbi:MAG TPA: hypothetical protein VII68_09310, partial [Casimicrobiaceae bacterium]